MKEETIWILFSAEEPPVIRSLRGKGMPLDIYLETRVGRNQTHEPLDDGAQEQGESGNMK